MTANQKGRALPTFAEVKKTPSGELMPFPIPNQKVSKDGGETMTLDVTWKIMSRDLEYEMAEGEIIATESITVKKDKGYYVGGKTWVQIIDANGKVNDSQDDFVKFAVDVYMNRSAFKADANIEKKSLLNIIENDRRYDVPTIENDGFYVDRDTWYFLLLGLNRKSNIILLGDSGGGKTELAELVAKKNGIPFSQFDMAISNPNNTLLGTHKIGEGGKSEFQLSRFAQTISNRGLILLDELSRAHPAVNNILLPLTDRRRTLFVEQNFEGNPEIPLHPKASIWATANIGMEYVGTTTLDNALMNRFMPVWVNFPPKDKEIKVIMARTGLDSKQATGLVEVATATRNGEYSKKISTRQLIECAHFIADGMDAVAALNFTIVNQYEKNGADGGEYAKVSALITSM